MMAPDRQRASCLPPRKVEFSFDFDKFLACVQYFASKNVPQLDKYKISKLLFLADKDHLVKYGRPIIGDRYCAIEHGPIPSRSLNLLNAFSRKSWVRLRVPDQPIPVPADQQLRQMFESLELDEKFTYPPFRTKKPPRLEFLSKSDLQSLDLTIKRFGNKTFNELKTITHSMCAYRKAYENPQNNDIDYEDFFEEDTESIKGAREQMLENDGIRRAFPLK
jgi:uncharacterized phage-associated protein